MNTAIHPGARRAALAQAALAALLLAAGHGPALAASVTLCAEPYEVSLPGAGNVPMWGYRAVADVAACAIPRPAPATAEPPVITMPAGDSTLVVTLVNKLQVPTSVVMSGQALPGDGGAPVHAVALTGPGCDPAADRIACRVRSFTGETEPGATRTYTFSGVRPGTFLLQSGTHPQVQVQMGLFALLRQDAAPVDTTARRLFVAPSTNAGASFDVDATVVLSEVDAAQHQLIQSTLGTAGNQGAWTGNSTFNYAPQHFLVNGRPFNGADVAANAIGISAPPAGRMVLRIANAGLQSRSLLINDGTWRLLTEDGHPYPAGREQASVLLPAGKTTDALIVNPGTEQSGPARVVAAVFDRRGGADAGNGMGGQVAQLAVTPLDPSTVNHAPVVNAGADQVLAFPANSTTLTGSLLDDTKPSATLGATWSASGPGTVTFGTPTQSFAATAAPSVATTTATFGTPGRYLVRLAGSDGALTTFDELVVDVRPAAADLSIAVNDGRENADTGSTFAYTVTVTNNGPQAVAGATVADTLPATMTGVTCTAPAGSSCAVAGNAVTATLANIAPGASLSITVGGRLNTTARGSLVNTATVAVPVGYDDPNTANNTVTDTDTIVVARPVLAVLDDFTRGNANTLGANWQQLVVLGAAGVRVNANQAFCVNSGLAATLCAAGANAYWSPVADFGAQQAAAVTVNVGAGAVNNGSLWLKAGGNFSVGAYASAIRVRYTTGGGGQVIVESTGNGGLTFTTAGNFSATFAANDVLTAMADALGTVYVWKTSGATTTALGNVQVAGFTGGGRIGLYLPSGGRVDNFAAGAVAP